jgi:two-component system OmpR family response regulator
MPGADAGHGAAMDGTRILVVDDDAEIRALLSEFLERHGFVVVTATDGADMDRQLAQADFDVAVLDVMMPGEDGLTILRRLTARGGPPVIMLSAIGSDIDRIVGLEMGAEDYLSKPCNPRELLARIRTVLRRTRRSAPAETASAPGKRLSFAGWQVDMDARLLTDPDNVLVTLTDGEFRLLRAFVERPRRVLSRDQLLDYSGGAESESYDRAIDVQVSRLRRKLERGHKAESQHGPDDLIRTIRNEGYMFTPDVRPS